MIKVYILDSNIEEIFDKGINQITDEEFIVLGKEHSLKEFENSINELYSVRIYNQSRDHVRFIEDEKPSLGKLIEYFSKGFTIHFVENLAVQEGKGFLHLNPKNMPKP